MTRESRLHLKILTPDGPVLDKGDLTAVNVPLANGYPIGIHPGHAPLIAETVKGKVRYRTTEDEDAIEINAGVLDIRANTVVILTVEQEQEVSSDATEPARSDFDRLIESLIRNLDTDQE